MDDSEDNIIFETADYDNHIVSLDEYTQEHIVIGHPALAGEEKHIKKTVEDPDNVFMDKEYVGTFSYYRQHNSVRLKGFGDLLKVSVDRPQGRIKTAYTVFEYDTEGVMVYSKESSE